MTNEQAGSAKRRHTQQLKEIDEINRRFAEDHALRPFPLSAALLHDGRVLLTGFINDHGLRQRAIEVAIETLVETGADAIINRITLRRPYAHYRRRAMMSRGDAV